MRSPPRRCRPSFTRCALPCSSPAVRGRSADARRRGAQVLNNCLASQPFSHLKVPQWVSTIVENCLKELAVMNDDTSKQTVVKFKYIGARSHVLPHLTGQPCPRSRPDASCACALAPPC